MGVFITSNLFITEGYYKIVEGRKAMGTNRYERWLTVGIILLFIGTCILPALAQDMEKTSLPGSRGGWLYVGGSGPGNYTKIQDAIDAALVGDTVFVLDDSSPYYEDITISKSISLLGEDRKTTVIDGQATPRFEINGENIVIKNITIQQGNINIWGSDILIQNVIIPRASDTAIYLYHCNKIKIFDSVIRESTYGLFLFQCQGIDIQGNNFIDNYYDGSFMAGKLPMFNRWSRNYWDDWDGTGPYVIRGKRYFIRWFNFDWHPAQEPYDI